MNNIYLKKSKCLSDIFDSYQIIKNLNNYYPNFQDWYWNKVVLGIMAGNDTLILAKQKQEIVGVSIIKKG